MVLSTFPISVRFPLKSHGIEKQPRHGYIDAHHLSRKMRNAHFTPPRRQGCLEISRLRPGREKNDKSTKPEKSPHPAPSSPLLKGLLAPLKRLISPFKGPSLLSAYAGPYVLAQVRKVTRCIHANVALIRNNSLTPVADRSKGLGNVGLLK